MADLDFYSSECNTETLSRFMLKRKPSSESIRERLTSLTNPPPPKQTAPKHSPKLIRISRNILKRKPQHVRHEEAELKKITLDRLYFARQQENAHERNNNIIPAIKKQKQLITHIGQQQLNAIKDHIQVIKQDISNRYPELPSPKPDNWFRQDETEDTPSDTTSHSSSSALHRRVTKKSRAIIEQGVVAPIHRKIKSFTHKTSAPSLTSHHATTPETTTTTRPEKLSIVTQGLPPQPGRESASSADYVPLRPYLKETSAVSLAHRPASNSSSSALPQWSTSAMVYLADDPTGQIDRWVFSSSLIPHATDPRPLSRRPAHRVSLDLPSRDSSETHRRKSESDNTLSQPAFSYAPLLNDPDHQAADSSSPFGGSNVIQDPQYFVEKQKPSQVILATDVLIEQQGGLSFLGKEKFNERFRSQPWQTVKTIRQYNRPGHLDAEYLPDVSRVAVV